MWRNFSFLYVLNLNNLWSFIEVYAVFVQNLCGEKSAQRKSVWRTNDKYEAWASHILFTPSLVGKSIGRIFPLEVLFSNRSKKLEKNRERISMNKRCSCRAHYFSQFTINIFWSREYLLFLKIPNRGKWSRKLRSMEIWKYGNYTKRQLIQQNCE